MDNIQHFFRLSQHGLLRVCVVYIFLSAGAMADSGFEEGFLIRDKNGASPDVFIYQNAVTPGLKIVDIRVNDQLAERAEVHFVSNNQQNAVPCLSREMLRKLGILSLIHI